MRLDTTPIYYDVAIAGAGLAGASLALWLARRGARVVAFEAQAVPRDKLCGEFLSPECWGVLDRLGLADAVARSGFQAIRRVRVTNPRGRVLEAEIVGPDDPPGIGLSRAVLDHRLVCRARDAGAEVIDRARVGGPIVAGGRVVGLRVGHPQLGSIAARARVVIAADGRHSTLVRQTGETRRRSRLRPQHFGLKRHLCVGDCEAAEPAGTVGLHLVPGGYVGTCRIEDSATNLCGLLPGSLARRYRGDLDRLAAVELRRNPVLARLWDASVPLGDWKTVAGVRVETAEPRLDGILYAGDCRGTVDPLGGQGMTMALLGAELLAAFVERALGGGGAADRALHRAYARAWDARFGRRVRLCRLFHHLLMHPALFDGAARFGALAPRLLAVSYALTRDPARARGGTIGSVRS